MNKIIFVTVLMSFIACTSNEQSSISEESKTESVETSARSESPISPEGLDSLQKKEQPVVIEKNEDTKIINDFIPSGYSKLDSIDGKLTNGTEITILVLDPQNERTKGNEENRTLVILKKVGIGFKQVASSKELILCQNCGGIFGDPYNGIELKEDVLSISNYGGSAWRWSEHYTFRYQNNDWQLIGATYESYYNAKACNGEAGLAGRQLEDINFSTGKMQIIHTKESECEPTEDYWKSFNKKTPITLNSFPGSPNQWPSRKIKDGDGKE